MTGIWELMHLNKNMEDKIMAVYDPAHPGELIRETLEGLREETGQRFNH